MDEFELEELKQLASRYGDVGDKLSLAILLTLEELSYGVQLLLEHLEVEIDEEDVEEEEE